jgi:hypothetical protein
MAGVAKLFHLWDSIQTIKRFLNKAIYGAEDPMFMIPTHPHSSWLK